MSAFMLIATLAVKAGTKPDYEAGRAEVAKIRSTSQFTIDDPYEKFESIVGEVEPDDNPGRHLTMTGRLKLSSYRQLALALIDNLEEALADDNPEVNEITIGGYQLFMSAGLSWGDPPTQAADAIWGIEDLPRSVRDAMGIIPDYREPPTTDDSRRKKD